MDRNVPKVLVVGGGGVCGLKCTRCPSNGNVHRYGRIVTTRVPILSVVACTKRQSASYLADSQVVTLTSQLTVAESAQFDS